MGPKSVRSISKYPCRRIYEELVCALEARAANRQLLTSLIKEASTSFSPVSEACNVQPSHIAKNSVNSFDHPPRKLVMPVPVIEEVCRTKKTMQPSRWVRMFSNVKLLPHMLTVFIKRELGWQIAAHGHEKDTALEKDEAGDMQED